MTKEFAVVELADGTITSISLDKYLASQMTIVEECTADKVEEKTSYWDRIYHYKDHNPKINFKYHFVNNRLKRTLYTNTPDPSKIRGLRGNKGYRLVES